MDLVDVFKALAKDLVEDIPAPKIRSSVLRTNTSIATKELEGKREPGDASKHLELAVQSQNKKREGLLSRLNVSKEAHSKETEELLTKHDTDTTSMLDNVLPHRKAGESINSASLRIEAERKQGREKLKKEREIEFSRGTLAGAEEALHKASSGSDASVTSDAAARHSALTSAARALGSKLSSSEALDPHKEERTQEYAALKNKNVTPPVAEPPTPAAEPKSTGVPAGFVVIRGKTLPETKVAAWVEQGETAEIGRKVKAEAARKQREEAAKAEAERNVSIINQVAPDLSKT